MPGSSVFHSLSEFAQIMSIDLVILSSHLILCCPVFFYLQTIPASGSFPERRLFASGGQKISFSFSIRISNEYSGLVSFRIDWFDLLAVQGTLKSLLQQHNSKPSFLRHSAFFMVQLSHQYMTNGKTIALTTWTFVSKVMSMLFNAQSKFVIAFLPRSKYLLISWLQSPSAMILEPRKIKSSPLLLFPHLHWSWSDKTKCHDLSFFWMLSFKPAFSLSFFTLIKKLFSSPF